MCANVSFHNAAPSPGVFRHTLYGPGANRLNLLLQQDIPVELYTLPVPPLYQIDRRERQGVYTRVFLPVTLLNV